MSKKKWPIIESRLDDIAKWVKEGAFEYAICKNLGISKPTWEKYKKEKPALKAVLEHSSRERNEKYIPLLKNTLLKVALGYVEEEAIVEENYRTTPDGDVVMNKKIIKKKIEPNVGAIQICLKNFTRDEEKPWTDNPVGDKLKKAKLDIEKKQAEAKANGW